jgi:hypothetical protein
MRDFRDEIEQNIVSSIRVRLHWSLVEIEENEEARTFGANQVEKERKEKRKEAKEKRKERAFLTSIHSVESRATLSPLHSSRQLKISQKIWTSKKQYTGDKKTDRYLKLWYDSGLKAHSKAGKAFEESVWKIQALQSGELFTEGALVPEKHKNKSFAFPQFLFSVERFKLAAFDREYFPNSKGKLYLQKMTLGDFLYFHYSQNFKNKSFFLYYLENEPRRITFVPDKNPKLTTEIIASYMKHISNGHSGEELLKNWLHSFRLASNHLHDYLESIKSSLHPMMVTSDKDRADILVKTAMKAFTDIKKISPGTLASNFVIERVPIFMQNQGFFLAGPNKFSIYKRTNRS